MKKFLKYNLLFFMPIIIFLVVLEVLTGIIPNSYSYKYDYVKTHGQNIQAIAIGHSQLYDGFKPESFYLPAFNLCNSAQSFVDNYYLLRELLPSMPSLKMVIMPIGYMDVGIVGYDSSLTDRCCYYHKYMNIDYDGHIPLKYRLECLDPLRACDKVYSYYHKHQDIVGCDSLGQRNTHYLCNRAHPLGYENVLDGCTLESHDRNQFCIKDEYYLMMTIKLLAEKKISLVLVSPPYYWDCFNKKNEEQQQFLQDYTVNLQLHHPVYYFNFQEDTLYTDDDFYNETHLSEFGAEKFTKALNDSIQSLITN